MPDLPPARRLHRHGAWSGMAEGQVRLDYEARFLRRRRLVTTGGEGFLVDLPATVGLEGGDALELEDGRLIAVSAAAEEVLVVTGPLARLAWHIGNRHTPCQILPGCLLIRRDHVLERMLRGLGAGVEPASRPFAPEGGAYGTGRVMGHDHGGGEGEGHSHAHADGHAHVHDHGERHAHSHSHAHADGHDHTHDHGDAHTQNHTHAEGHGQGEGQSQTNTHTHSRSHVHIHGHSDGHAHTHAHGDGHGHTHEFPSFSTTLPTARKHP